VTAIAASRRSTSLFAEGTHVTSCLASNVVMVTAVYD
jgi:hypothetical protein